MKLKVVSGIELTVLLVGMLTLAFSIQPAKSEPLVYVFEVMWDGEIYRISVESNSTVSNFYFDLMKEFGFNVTGQDGTIGFCNVTIPKVLLRGDCMIFIDGAPVPSFIVIKSATHTMLCFTYTHSTHRIQIEFIYVIGTGVLRVFSSPTGVTFTVDGVSHTTPWGETYIVGTSVDLVMPETHDVYVWSHWLEDGDTNRIKTVTVGTFTTFTGVFTFVPPQPPVGGKAIPINMPIIEPELQTPWIWLTTIILPLVATVVYISIKKR